ncbi:MAG: hypothetical protein BMS9Abin36_2123 [Gammaproteobacteria bacterium]|nr:MAG: hypothetical protein BMS9Abin36_2123 [Gammaproteobacteria bacterium]
MSKSDDTKGASTDRRKMIFTLNPDDIGISKEGFGHPVWGIVMETGDPEGSFSLVTLADGNSSLYFSNGSGIFGGGEHESVREASAYFLTGAQHFYLYAEKVDEYPSPSDGEVLFYFLTFDDVLSFATLEEELRKPTNVLAHLYQAGHGLISELRKLEEK